MDESTANEYFLILNYAMRQDFRETVVKRALEWRKSSDSAVCRGMESTVRRNLSIPGFRNASRAAVFQLVGPLARATNRRPSVWRTILPVWIESQSDLQMSVREFLSDRGMVLPDPEPWDGFENVWTTAEMSDLAEEFTDQRPDADRDDVALMMCCVTRKVPFDPDMVKQFAGEGPHEPDEPTEEARQELPRWRDWLSELEALPADAPEWDSVQSFIEALQRLAEEKLQERESAWSVLRQALASLPLVTAELQYFGLLAALDWTAETCALGEAADLASQVSALQQCLMKHGELRQRPAATYTEDQARLQEMDALAADIVHLYDVLANRLTDSGPPGPLPSEGGSASNQADDALAGACPDDSLSESVEPASAECVDQSEDSASLDAEQVLSGDGLELQKEQHPTTEVQQPGVAEPQGDKAEVELLDRPDLAEEAVAAAREDVTPRQSEAIPDSQTPDVSMLAPSSIKEAAARLQADESSEAWTAFLMALVAEGDLGGAYWLARSLAARGEDVPLPDWLLAAVQASCWLDSDSEQLALDLLGIAQSHHLEGDGAQAMLGLAASLRPTLLAPVSGMLAWLRSLESCPWLHGLVTAIGDFASLGLALRPSDLLGVAGAEQREAAIADAARAGSRWLEEAPARRPNYTRAARVWSKLTGAQGEIREMLLPVAEDRRGELEAVLSALDRWQARDTVQEAIDDVDMRLVGKKRQRIVGAARQSIIRGVDDACSIARHWCGLVRHEQEVAKRGDWLTEQLASLRESVERVLPDVEDGLTTTIADGQDLATATAALCLHQAVSQLRVTLGLSGQVDGPRSENALDWLPHQDRSLQEALNRRLLWLPEIALDDDGTPEESAVPDIARALVTACSDGRSPSTAFEMWLEHQDYRFAETLLDALRREQEPVDLARLYQEAKAGSMVALRENKDRAVSAIEQAVLDGILTEEQRAGFLDAVESIWEEEVLDFGAKHRKLQGVRADISEARQKRLRDLRAGWEQIQTELIAHSVDPDVRRQLVEVIEDALQRGDTRIIEEHLARLRQLLDKQSELLIDWLATEPSRDPLREFVDHAEEISQWFEQKRTHAVAMAIEQGRTSAGVPFGNAPGARLEQAARAFKEWRRLKQEAPSSPYALKHVEAVLRYLDFAFAPDASRPLAIEQSGNGWLHLRALVSAGDLAKPIPQFGSQAQGRYDVVCLWERPGADSTAARLRQLRLSANAVLVLYLGRLSTRQRRDMLRMTREQHIAMALLDEVLFVFLAQERDTRLPTFLRCSLPFAAVNPYTPFQAGDVPPEMFFGREEMARELQRAAGGCLVYGGRQLGKSALLRHVQRQFHNPKRHQYAWIENMELVFDPQAGRTDDNVWRTLRDRFKEAGLISSHVRTGRREDIYKYMKEAVLQDPECRVLAMFDEADGFLDTDAANGFRTVIQMRELMAETGRRFKVVFAGLHHVQRFQGIPNQPLAHFGAPLCVGPLEPTAAEQLVRQPLEALGFRFSEGANSAVLRVLSYTNYHPGLIQLFCHELLLALQARTAGHLPPYDIGQSDVEAVYRHRDVRDRIRERFDWTLALDTRYQVIAWALIVDQITMRDSYARAYPPGEILAQAREWWPSGFRDVNMDQLRGLLDEMCGLGVLVRNPEGHFRLRSPNLVRLMGAEADIENRLLAIETHEPVPLSGADTHHAALDEDASRYSPLTYAQERSLNPPRSGLGMVFASPAGGANDLMEAFRQFAATGPQESMAWLETPAWAVSAESLVAWLDGNVRQHGDAERIVFCHRLVAGEEQAVVEAVGSVLNWCQRLRLRGPRVRVFFLFDSVATWNWLRLPEDRRGVLEDSADAVVWPGQWNESGLQRRLNQHDKLGIRDVSRTILDVTGGWHMLLDALFSRCGTESDPRPSVEEMAGELVDPETRLHKSFVSSLGIEHEAVQRVLRFLLREGPVTPDLVVPDLVGGEPLLHAGDCPRVLEYLKRMGVITMRGKELGVDQVVQKVMVRP